MAVLGYPFLTDLRVSVDVKQHRTSTPESRSCVKVEVAVLGYPFLTAPRVSADVKQNQTLLICLRVSRLSLAQAVRR